MTKTKLYNNKNSNSLALRMFCIVLSFSVIFSFITCSVWIYVDYGTRVANVEQTFDRIENTFLPGIGKSLWELDKDHLKKYVQGICAESEINYAKITSDDGSVIENGSQVQHSAIVKEIPIVHKDGNYALKIGTLQLQSDKYVVINSVIGGLLSIFVFQTVVVFAVATFFFIIFNRMVTSHLLDIASYMGNLSTLNFNTPLTINRKPRKDELDTVVDSFNHMRELLISSFDNLRSSKEMFSRTFFSAPLLMTISCLEDGKYIEVNDAFLSVSGFSREEVINHTSTEIGWVSSSDRQKLLRELQQFGRIRDHEIVLTSKSGSKVYCNYSGELISIDGNDRLLSIALNITEERRLHRESEAIKIRLEQAQKMEAIGRLAGGIAHDFNNKLTVIMGFAELIKMSGKLIDEQITQFEMIVKAAEQSRDLIRQLLSFSRKSVIAPKQVNINDQLRDKLNGMSRLLGEDIEITLKLANDIWPVLIDPVQFDQIIMNLTVNARDAMPLGGRIRLETKNIEADEAFNNRFGQCKANYVLLSVSDTGHGINDDLLPYIFEPFYTTKENEKGTGLGLATVYGIIQQNQGMIDVLSEVGKGTSFEIYLPKTEISEVQKLMLTQQSTVSGAGNILLVEDENDIRMMVKLMLEQFGYKVIETKSPENAIEIIKQNITEIELLITDVVMPQINGIELSNQIITIEPKIKVLYMSGYAHDVVSQYGLAENNFNFIKKPFSAVDLSMHVRRVLQSFNATGSA